MRVRIIRRLPVIQVLPPGSRGRRTKCVGCGDVHFLSERLDEQGRRIQRLMAGRVSYCPRCKCDVTAFAPEDA